MMHDGHGGFHGGNVADPAFQKLMVRWLQSAVLTPALRRHGHCNSITPPTEPFPDDAAQSDTGAGSELWSFGAPVYATLRDYAAIRERLRPYVATLMRAAHETGDPLMRPMFCDGPGDPRCQTLDDRYIRLRPAGGRAYRLYLRRAVSV